MNLIACLLKVRRLVHLAYMEDIILNKYWDEFAERHKLIFKYHRFCELKKCLDLFQNFTSLKISRVTNKNDNYCIAVVMVGNYGCKEYKDELKAILKMHEDKRDAYFKQIFEGEPSPVIESDSSSMLGRDIKIDYKFKLDLFEDLISMTA